MSLDTPVHAEVRSYLVLSFVFRVLFNRPLSQGGHFESQENKKLCFCPSSLALNERLDGQNLLFQQCVIKVYLKRSAEMKISYKEGSTKACSILHPATSFSSIPLSRPTGLNVLHDAAHVNLQFSALCP